MLFRSGQTGVEEHGEVLLGLLSHLRKRYTGYVTLDLVDCLWVTLDVKQQGAKVGVSNVSEVHTASMATRLNAYLSRERICIPYCPWKAKPMTEIQKHWPLRCGEMFPTSLSQSKDTSFYKKLLSSVLLATVKQVKWKRGMVAHFDSVFSRRSPSESNQRIAEAQDVIAKLQRDVSQ